MREREKEGRERIKKELYTVESEDNCQLCVQMWSRGKRVAWELGNQVTAL
jgi:hypothetical protein